MATRSQIKPRTRRRKTSQKVFVVGCDPFNEAMIAEIPGMEDFEIVTLLTAQDVQPPSGHIDFDDLYARARTTIDTHGGAPAAIVGHLDFPVTSLLSLLNRDYGLPGASPEAVARCEHKYWLRLEQAAALPDATPQVRAINPFDTDGARRDALPFPFWLKPVKCHSSVLGFLVHDAQELDRALHACRQKIHYFGEPFNRYLRHVDTSALDGIDGNFAIAEEIISAPVQFTMEGYVHDGKTTIYGVVLSSRAGRRGSSLSCYCYPAELPAALVERATEITAKLLAQVCYDAHPFNVEFFWNPRTDALHLLEINPRISKSHSPLFRMVDGVSHHKIALDLSFGRTPRMPRGEGKNKVAAKFMLRSFEADGIVKRIPADDEIKDLARILPDIKARMLVEKEQRLSDLFYQDSYSFELAEIFLGGESEEMLEDAYARCIDSLPFLIKPMPMRA